MTTFSTSDTQLRAPDMCPNCLKPLPYGEGVYINMSDRYTETQTARHTGGHGERSTTETTQQATVVLNVKYCSECHDDYMYRDALEFLPAMIMVIAIVLYLFLAMSATSGELDILSRAMDFIRGLLNNIYILIIGGVATVCAWFYANSRLDRERMAARQKAQSAIHVRKVSLSVAEIEIREALFAEKFREINEL